VEKKSRSFVRSPCEASILYAQSPGTYYRAVMYNVSKGGIYFEAEAPLVTGDVVHVKVLEAPFALSRRGYDEDVYATVKWVRRQDHNGDRRFGVGVQSVDPLLQMQRLSRRVQKERTLRTASDAEEMATPFSAEQLPLSYQSLDGDGLILEVNRIWTELLGYRRDEVVGKWFGHFLDAEGVESFNETFPCFKERGTVHGVRLRMVKKSGESMEISLEGKASYHPNGRFKQTHCVFYDVTERNRQEEILKENERRVSQIIEGSPVPMFVLNSRHEVTHWNKACARLTGVDAEEMLGRADAWRAFYDTPTTILADYLVGGASQEELYARYGDRVVPSDLLRDAFAVEDFFPGLGESGKWLYFTSAPIRDGRGNVIAAIETCLDLTDKRRAVEEQLYREKLQGVLEMAGAVCHEMNQPLMIISGYAELMHLSLADSRDNPLYAKTGKIKEAVDRMAKITAKIKEITRYETFDYMDGHRIIDIEKASRKNRE